MLAAARGKYRSGQSIVWGGCKLSFFPDMTKEWAEKRQKFREVRKKLHALDVRFTLAYQAELHFTWRRKQMKSGDYCEAMEFLNMEHGE